MWAEIDLGAIEHNLSVVRQLAPAAEIMAVVKANGYGHGAIAVARRAVQCGASRIGVARISEALSLRDDGMTEPILIFGYTPPDLADVLIQNNLTQTVASLSYGQELNHHARCAGGKLSVHIKIDTGMGRLGFNACEPEAGADNRETGEDGFIAQIKQLFTCEHLNQEGIYTHFAASDRVDKTSAKRQLEIFIKQIALLDEQNITFQIKHAANSGGVCTLPESHLDMVRPGIMLYGLYPSEELRSDALLLKPAMQIKAKIAQIKDVPKGFTVSYGHTYITPEATRLATIPIGYGDGYNRHLSSLGTMLVRGQRAPVVGRVCMDQTIIDVGHIEGVSTVDEVTILGQQGGETILADEIASQLETINYEVVTALMSRVPRIIV